MMYRNLPVNETLRPAGMSLVAKEPPTRAIPTRASEIDPTSKNIMAREGAVGLSFFSFFLRIAIQSVTENRKNDNFLRAIVYQIVTPISRASSFYTFGIRGMQ